MSGEDLKALTGEIGELSGKINNFSLEVERRIGDMNRVVDTIQGGWQGAASQQYDTVQSNLNRKLKGLQQDLENLQNLVRMSADGFDEQERQRMASFAKMENANGRSSAILDV